MTELSDLKDYKPKKKGFLCTSLFVPNIFFFKLFSLTVLLLIKLSSFYDVNSSNLIGYILVKNFQNYDLSV